MGRCLSETWHPNSSIIPRKSKNEEEKQILIIGGDWLYCQIHCGSKCATWLLHICIGQGEHHLQ